MEQITVKVDGMHCSMCEAHVNDLFRKALNPKKVSSNHHKGESVILSENPIEKSAIEGALDGSGYRVLDVKSEPYTKKGILSFFKR